MMFAIGFLVGAAPLWCAGILRLMGGAERPMDEDDILNRFRDAEGLN